MQETTKPRIGVDPINLDIAHNVTIRRPRFQSRLLLPCKLLPAHSAYVSARRSSWPPIRARITIKLLFVPVNRNRGINLRVIREINERFSESYLPTFVLMLPAVLRYRWKPKKESTASTVRWIFQSPSFCSFHIGALHKSDH